MFLLLITEQLLKLHSYTSYIADGIKDYPPPGYYSELVLKYINMLECAPIVIEQLLGTHVINEICLHNHICR